MAQGLKQKAEFGSSVGEVILRFLEGENEGVEIRVTPPRQLTVGRSEECDIFLGEKKISRKHCLIAVSADGVSVKDLQSTNGIYLNAKKIVEKAIESDDKLRVGSSVILFTIHPPSATSPKEEPSNAELAETAAMPDHIEELESPSGVLDVPEEEPFEISVIEPPREPVAEIKKPKPLSGNLSAMGLADLLQNLAQNRKSGLLHLSAVREGKIWIVQGKVLGGETGKAKGSKAIYRMLGWNEGEFELLPLPPDFNSDKLESPLAESMDSLLIEGFRQFDELEKLKKGLPPLVAKLSLIPNFTAPLSKLHPRVLDILQVVLNEGTFERVLDASPFSDLETSKIVFYLIKKEYLESA